MWCELKCKGILLDIYKRRGMEPKKETELVKEIESRRITDVQKSQRKKEHLFKFQERQKKRRVVFGMKEMGQFSFFLD